MIISAFCGTEVEMAEVDQVRRNKWGLPHLLLGLGSPGCRPLSSAHTQQGSPNSCSLQNRGNSTPGVVPSFAVTFAATRCLSLTAIRHLVPSETQRHPVPRKLGSATASRPVRSLQGAP